MKELDGWVKIKKYTDGGKPVCGKCKLYFDTYDCEYSIAGDGPEYSLLPGFSCPVWHGESKSGGKPIHGEPTEPGYYWWLPVCSSGKEHNLSHWNIIAWHPKDERRQKSGTFVGPILPPISPQEKINHERKTETVPVLRESGQ